MSKMLRASAEWLAAYERRMGIGNCELVKITSEPKLDTSNDANGVSKFYLSHNAGSAIRKDAPVRRIEKAPSPLGTPAPITLPWPPTGNTAVRHANGAHYLRQEVVGYRNAVATHVAGKEPAPQCYALEVELSPPDRRARDIDNVLKSLLDALVKAGWLPGDSMAHMRKLTVTVRPDYVGAVYVRAIPA